MSRINTLYPRSRAIAEIMIVICYIPALFWGCSASTGPLGTLSDEDDGDSEALSNETCTFEINVKSADGSTLSHTDIFIFNDDSLRRLDSYQRLEGTAVKAASRAGQKLLVAIANSSLGKEDWRRINSYDGLMEEMSSLADEDPEYPLMSGQTFITAGSGLAFFVSLNRLMSKVVVRTICADFSGTEFAGEKLTDVRFYLTNVNASCTIMKESDFRPVSLVNVGGLDLVSMDGFKVREMLLQDLDDDVGAAGIAPGTELYCYPNDTEEETYGSPFTRLVIEGKICGMTCYYPLPINREENGVSTGGDGTGIGRNCLYTYDVVLCRFGTDDPDIPVRAGDVILRCSIEPWTEMDSETIIF